MGSKQDLIHRGKLSLKRMLVLICLVFLVSCALPKPVINQAPITTSEPIISTSTPFSIGNPTQSVTPLPTSSKTPQPALSSQVTPEDGNSNPVEVVDELTRYELDAIFDYIKHSLSVTESISYVNNTPDTLIDLILVVEPNRREGGFNMESLTWKTGESVEEFKLASDQLHILLPKPLAPGEGIEIIIRYALELPEIPPPSDTSRPTPYGYTERQTNIVDWYPYIPPYRSGDGWLVHQNWWFGEHQVFDMADFNIRFRMAEPIQDLVIAASAPVEQDGDTYVYQLEAARSFALSASNQYLVQTKNIGDVTIYSYSFSYDEYAGEEVLQNTTDALQLYSQLIMPYTHASLSVVEADFLDGMEYDGLYFLSRGFYNLYDGTPKGYLTFIAAHETAHQWWYGLVGNDQALEPWLDEALCTYMEHIFYENIYADYPTGSDQSLVDWWWYYRVNFYEPDGWINGAIYDFARFRPYRDAVYLNGAKFLNDLRVLIGDQAFFAFLRDYASQNKTQIATATGFFSILEENTSKDLDGLIEEYFQEVK
jgi:hypothetical protein